MGTGLKIFIAEDDALILEDFTITLEEMGHIVVGTASNGESALNGIQNLRPDLILIDINMPKKDGITVMEEINQTESIPAIIITGYCSQELLDRASNLSVYGYLLKPIDAKQMQAAVEIAIKRAKDVSVAKEALENRKYIERAKGILMDQFGLSESDAMKRLQKKSRDANKKLAVIAKEIIEAAQLLM